jgi:hypothetical protein
MPERLAAPFTEVPDSSRYISAPTVKSLWVSNSPETTLALVSSS